MTGSDGCWWNWLKFHQNLIAELLKVACCQFIHKVADHVIRLFQNSFIPQGKLQQTDTTWLDSCRQQRFFNLAFSCLLTKPNVTAKLTRLKSQQTKLNPTEMGQNERKESRQLDNQIAFKNEVIWKLYRSKIESDFSYIFSLLFNSGSKNARKVQCSVAVNKDDWAS